MLYHNSMKNKFCPYRLYFFLIFFITAFLFLCSCSSQTHLYLSDNITSFSTISELTDEFFNLVNDSDIQNNNKTTDEITALTLDAIVSALSPYCNITALNRHDTSFSIDANQLNISELILFVNKSCPEENKIFYYDENNTLHMNINVSNYFALSEIIPILKNETFFAYTAIYNQDITREEFKDLISYAISPKISAVMDECILTVSIKDENSERSKSFSITDFMLLHEPITI